MNFYDYFHHYYYQTAPLIHVRTSVCFFTQKKGLGHEIIQIFE